MPKSAQKRSDRSEQPGSGRSRWSPRRGRPPIGDRGPTSRGRRCFAGSSHDRLFLIAVGVSAPRRASRRPTSSASGDRRQETERKTLAPISESLRRSMVAENVRPTETASLCFSAVLRGGTRGGLPVSPVRTSPHAARRSAAAGRPSLRDCANGSENVGGGKQSPGPSAGRRPKPCWMR